MKNSLLLFLVTAFIFGGCQSKTGNGNNEPPVTFTAEQDHQNMMDQLGIVSLRPGPRSEPDVPGHANYDELLASPYPDLPEILTMKNGQKVTAPEQWWNERRPEIVKDVEIELYGRLPETIPQVTWTVEVSEVERLGRTQVIAKKLVGHVDNSACPSIDVNINMVLVTPANSKGPVPVLMMFGRPSLPSPVQPAPDDLAKINKALRKVMAESDPVLKELLEKYPAYAPLSLPASSSPFGMQGPGMQAPGMPGAAAAELPATQQLIAAGWGYATIDPSSIQADNGAGLTRGIIGLVNKGQPRKPEDWGALRAWAWGAARGLDYLETDTTVNAKQVGIEGVSRYGKAALVTLAFEQRFAMALIGSSGKGGATLHRRVFGEAVESLTGTGEYHWMCGNYLKYGASESKFGEGNAGQLTVDSHFLLAMCAPRLTFVSYGIPEQGDANWLDQKGSYQATIAAGEVFKLLGVKDLGVSNDYKTEVMPPYNTDMLNGQLAWRQHDGGHTDLPNMKYFIRWASENLNYQPALSAR